MACAHIVKYGHCGGDGGGGGGDDDDDDDDVGDGSSCRGGGDSAIISHCKGVLRYDELPGIR